MNALPVPEIVVPPNFHVCPGDPSELLHLLHDDRLWLLGELLDHVSSSLEKWQQHPLYCSNNTVCEQ